MRQRKICKIDGCDKRGVRRGVCVMHYHRYARTGTYELRPKPNVLERLEKKTVKLSNGCHEFTGCIYEGGYGIIVVNGERRPAHRMKWEAFHNCTLSPEIFVCHKCDNPPCINIDHLFLGTVQDNNRDRTLKTRQAWGEKNAGCKLTEDQVREIRTSKGLTQAVLANKYGVTISAIKKILYRKTWKYLDSTNGRKES